MKNSMKKWIALLMTSALIPLSVGCQEIKAQAAIIPNDADRMLAEAIIEKESVPANAPVKMVTEKYTKETPLKNSQGTLTVVFDAEVIQPENAEMPTVRVVPRNFSTEDCMKYADALFQGEPMYTGKGLELAEQISLWRDALASGLDKETEKRITDDLQQLQTEMDNLSDEPIRLEEVLQSTDKKQTIHVISDGKDGVYRSLRLSLAPEECVNQLEYQMGTNGFPEIRNVWSTVTSAGRKRGEEEYGDIDGIADPQISEEEAAAEAEALLQSMELDAYSVQSAELVFGKINGKLQKAWQLSFTHEINGIPLTYSSYNQRDFGSHQLFEDEWGNTRPVWGEEFLDILVTDDGIARMRWSTPFESEEMVTSNTHILSFKEILPILEDMLLTQYGQSEPGIHEEIQIDRVFLGLGRILDEESLNSGLLVPMWTAYGTRTTYMNGSSNTVEDPDAELIRLNAVDGTAIRPPWDF